MLGKQISETTGRRILRRVLSSAPLEVEVSFEDSGKMLGVGTNGFGTYKASVGPGGALFGEGAGAMVTEKGEMITWEGSARGKLKQDGGVSYRGVLYFQTASKKFAQLNEMTTVFEYEVDAEGKSVSKVWEWK